MKKFAKALAAIMLMVAVVITAGCKKTDDPNNGGNGGGGNGGGSNPTVEAPGIYLGIIGFNDQLYTKDISFLNSTTLQEFKDFINGFVARDLTALYYADYVALQKLQAFPEPPQLTNVALVTFTDGLDNLSTENNEQFQYDPEGYGTRPAYRTALHDKIVHDKVHGKDINAYTIGLRGNDVSSSTEFSQNMNALASESGNVFEVANMSEALRKFDSIAESLYSVTTTVSLTVKIPGGVVDDGQHIRFAFDNVNAPNNTMYIEGTYNKGVNPRRLDNLSYHGFQDGAPSIASISNDGGFYFFKFENLNLTNGDPISQTIVDRIVMWKETSEGTGWDRESEFHPNNNTNIEEDKSSAIIMLVLDCTTSLGSDFSTMQMAAKSFVETLVSSNNGGGGGGGNTQFYDISVSANPSNGGTVTGGGTFQQGNSCTVQATANTGYSFSNWTENGSQVSTNANYTFTVTGNRSLVANFSSGNPPTISVYQGNGFISDGDVIDNVGEYSFGFVTHSNIGLSSLTINYSMTDYNEIDEGVWDEEDLSGLTSYTYMGDLSFGKEILGEITFTAIVSDVEGRTSNASIRVFVNQPEQPEPIEAWLYYGAWNDHLNCWGLTDGGDDEWAVMFPASMLSPYNGASITSVDVYIGEDGDYTLNIYKGGTSQPTTLLKSEYFYAEYGWNSIDISPLLLQTSSSLWVSISCSYDAGMYPKGACEGVNNKNARWCNPNGLGWRDVYDSNGNVDICWEIQVFVTNNAKGEKGKEILLPQLPFNQGENDAFRSVQNPKENLLKAKPKK